MTDLHPVRGYSWPPFEPGNDKAKTHGVSQLLNNHPATPAQLVGIEQTLVELLTEFPFLHEADQSTLRRLARLQYEIDTLAEYGDKVRAGEDRVILRGAGRDEPRTGLPAWYASGLSDQLGKLIEKASNLSTKLGLNPAGRFAIAKDLYTAARTARSTSALSLLSEGRKLRRGDASAAR